MANDCAHTSSRVFFQCTVDLVRGMQFAVLECTCAWALARLCSPCRYNCCDAFDAHHYTHHHPKRSTEDGEASFQNVIKPQHGRYFNMDQAILNALEIYDNMKETGKLQPKRRPEDFGPGDE